MATPTLPSRDSPLWKEAISGTTFDFYTVRSIPHRSGVVYTQILKGDGFSIIPSIEVKADGYKWYPVKTVSVVGWCAAPPLTYTLVTPPPVEPPLPDDDTQPIPTLPGAIYSAYLSDDEIRQAIVFHTQIAIANNQIAALYQAALDRGQTT